MIHLFAVVSSVVYGHSTTVFDCRVSDRDVSNRDVSNRDVSNRDVSDRGVSNHDVSDCRVFKTSVTCVDC